MRPEIVQFPVRELKCLVPISASAPGTEAVRPYRTRPTSSCIMESEVVMMRAFAW